MARRRSATGRGRPSGKTTRRLTRRDGGWPEVTGRGRPSDKARGLAGRSEQDGAGGHTTWADVVKLRMRRREPAGGNVIQAQRTGASGKEPDEGMEEGPDPSCAAAMPCGAWAPGRVKSRFEIKI